MTSPPVSSGHSRLTTTEWLICFVAALGFAFDIYELLMLPLIVGPALLELLGARPGSPEFNLWVGWLFWLPAVAGGIFGLLGGYLTDLFGRRRVLVWSILLYAFSAMAAGFAPTVGWLLLFRCTTFVGVCVEFVAAVAWLAELFPEPKRREAVLGWTQAFSSVGGLLVTGAYFLAVHYAESLPAIAGGHAPWRYTLISGVIPALPLIVIRPFLPESPAWRVKKEAGTLKRPSLAAIFQGDLKKVTLVTTLMFACSYGAAFGAIQHVPRIVPGLAEVSVLPRLDQQKVVSGVQAFQEFGGLAGRMILAFLAVRIVSRRRLLRIFQVPGLVLLPVVFVWAAVTDLDALKWGIFLVGLLTVAQFSFWGNYLPRMYPTHLRGTGESFAANVGGRMIGTSAAFVTTTLATSMPGGTPSVKLAWAAALVGFAVYAVGFVASFFLPEPKAEALPDCMNWRSARAVLAGVLVAVVVTTVIDVVLHVVGVFPPLKVPLTDGLALVASSYRIVIGIACAWLTARLAPRDSMRHVMILGGLGAAVALVGVVATWNLGLGPRWYPISLVVLALPQSWVGGRLFERQTNGSASHEEGRPRERG